MAYNMLAKLSMAKDKEMGHRYGQMALITQANGKMIWPKEKANFTKLTEDSIKEISYMTNFTALASTYPMTKNLFTKDNFSSICCMATGLRLH